MRKLKEKKKRRNKLNCVNASNGMKIRRCRQFINVNENGRIKYIKLRNKESNRYALCKSYKKQFTISNYHTHESR